MFKAYGKNKQIKFNTESEYYQALGYIAQPKNQITLHREDNQEQGAYSYEVRARIKIDNPNIPGNFKLTTGTGNVKYRVNCNPYFEEITTNHGFELDTTQDIEKIKATIPSKYLDDFEKGYLK
jgi:hypothetical protein